MPPLAVPVPARQLARLLDAVTAPRRLSAAVHVRLPIRPLDAVASPERLVAPALERLQIRLPFAVAASMASFQAAIASGVMMASCSPVR
jgi:hypothetical protein